MSEIFKFLSPQLLQAIGFLTVIALILSPKIISWWQYEKRGIDRRTDDNGNGNDSRRVDVNRLLDIMQQNVDNNRESIHEMQKLNETVRDLLDAMNRRSEKAFEQHGEILEKIGGLDVPRKKHAH